jgi:NAD(P)-dependent dehydrogenase (short-subunit alcohol dehydrogenase family)
MIHTGAGSIVHIAPHGIRVNTVSPGFIQSGGAERLIASVSQGHQVDREEALRKIMDSLGGIPLGRPASPEDVAESQESNQTSGALGVPLFFDGECVPANQVAPCKARDPQPRPDHCWSLSR